MKLSGALFLSLLFAGPLFAGADLPLEVPSDRLSSQLVWDKIRQMPVSDRPRIILVLGGGGARGLAHIGVLRVLQEENIPVDEIVGVSVGALIGALYADGVSPDQLDQMAAEVGWNSLTNYSKASLLKLILHENLFSSEKMETYLKNHIGDKNFSDLKIPFSTLATDLKTGERVFFNEGPVAIAARASATIPGLFSPVQYRHRLLVDGGLVDNLPTDVVSKGPYDVVIAVIAKVDEKREETMNVFTVLMRSLEIQRNLLIEQNRKTADFLIEPNVGNMSLVDLGRAKECIKIGTIEGHARVANLKQLIINRTLARLKAAQNMKEAKR